MKSLINRAIEEFLRATYGEDLVQSVADEEAVAVGRLAPLGAGFGTGALERAAFRLSKPLPEMFEDLGGWMTRIEPVRRLLRFSGRDFKDFLLRLEELPGRAHLVLPDLESRACRSRRRISPSGWSCWNPTRCGSIFWSG